MATCNGNEEDHCCYLKGKVCEYLEENTVPGRRWVCGIRKKYNSWEETHHDPDYTRDIKPLLNDIGITNCGEWPRQNEKCAICGVIG